MNQDEQNRDPAEQPQIADEEMKLPENANPQPSAPTPGEEPSVINGPLLVGLTVLLLLILGGMYFWFSTMITPAPEPVPTQPTERPTPEENDEPESTTAEAQVQQLETVSSSDEISAIEADLEATDLEELDAELNAIDAELEAAMDGQ